MWQWLGIICGGLVVLFILFNVVKAWILVRRFRRLPEVRWRDEVVRAMGAAHQRALAEQEEMRRAGVEHEADDQALRDRAFHAFLAGISVTELEAYPGIGPVTIGKLHEAGYGHLAALYDAGIDVGGLGQKRLADVTHAVQDLVKQARSRFDAGACREAQELVDQLEFARASRSEQGLRAQARHLAALDVMQELEERTRFAEHLDFGSFMRREIDPSALLSFMALDFPDLEAALREADERAGQEFTQRQREAAEQPVAAEPRDAGRRGRPARPRAAASAPRIIPFPGAGTTTEPPLARPATPELRTDLFHEALHSAPPPPVARIAETKPADERDVTLLQLTVEFAFAVARCDGRVAQKERDVISEYLERRWGQDSVLSKRAKAFCAQYEFSLIDPDACLQQIAVVFPAAERAAILDLGYAIADASAGRNPRESMFLEKTARKLGLEPPAEPVTPPPVQEKTAPPEPKPVAPSKEMRLAVLEIDPATPLAADLIRRQYHLLSARYAVEKFASAGPEFMAVAQAKREAVVEAANALIEPFGEPLELPAGPAEPPELRHNPDLDAMFGD